MSKCTVCSHHPLKEVLDLGEQPPANRFLTSLENEQETHRIGMGYCPQCATVQLSSRMPLQAVKPRFSWMTYNEPEQHLDDTAAKVRQLPGIGTHSKMLGLTYKDQSTLDRLVKLGLPQGICLTTDDFSIFRTPQINSELKCSVDLLFARHVIEHAEDAAQLIKDLKEWIAPGGYLIFELPDSDKILRAGNHAFIWEEHISYFTERSLALLAWMTGAEIVWSASYSYPFEDSLVAAFQFSETPSLDHPKIDSKVLLDKFSQGFSKVKKEWKDRLQSYRKEGHRLAVFGAGHLAVKWINFLGVAEEIECVIDDNPHKAGMYMPGSKLPILPSRVLQERGIKVCISTLSPESELKVKQKFTSYFEEGGIFIPAFKVLQGT